LYNVTQRLHTAPPRWLRSRFDVKPGDITFYHDLEVLSHPIAFKAWALKLLAHWDFENLVCAKQGAKIGGANIMLIKLLKRLHTEQVFEKTAERQAHKALQLQEAQQNDDDAFWFEGPKSKSL
jgi:hypothetical protein